jgi:hypothetical protein
MSTPMVTPATNAPHEVTNAPAETTYAAIERDGTITRTDAPAATTHGTVPPAESAPATEGEWENGWYPPHKGDGLQVVRGYSNQPGWGEPLNVSDFRFLVQSDQLNPCICPGHHFRSQ